MTGFCSRCRIPVACRGQKPRDEFCPRCYGSLKKSRTKWLGTPDAKALSGEEVYRRKREQK